MRRVICLSLIILLGCNNTADQSDVKVSDASAYTPKNCVQMPHNFITSIDNQNLVIGKTHTLAFSSQTSLGFTLREQGGLKSMTFDNKTNEAQPLRFGLHSIDGGNNQLAKNNIVISEGLALVSNRQKYFVNDQCEGGGIEADTDSIGSINSVYVIEEGKCIHIKDSSIVKNGSIQYDENTEILGVTKIDEKLITNEELRAKFLADGPYYALSANKIRAVQNFVFLDERVATTKRLLAPGRCYEVKIAPQHQEIEPTLPVSNTDIRVIERESISNISNPDTTIEPVNGPSTDKCKIEPKSENNGLFVEEDRFRCISGRLFCGFNTKDGCYLLD